LKVVPPATPRWSDFEEWALAAFGLPDICFSGDAIGVVLLGVLNFNLWPKIVEWSNRQLSLKLFPESLYLSVEYCIVEASVVFAGNLLKANMAPAGSDEQLLFLISCIRHSENGRVGRLHKLSHRRPMLTSVQTDFEEVRNEVGICSKGAA